MSRPRRALLLSLVVCLSVVAGAARASAQYRFDSFTTSNGLPQNTVSALAQTRDGVRFTIFDRGNTRRCTTPSSCRCGEDAAGTLWAGTVEGGLLRYRDGVFTSLTTADAAGRSLARLFYGRFTTTTPDVPAHALFLDRDRTLWIGAQEGLWTLKDGRMTDRSALVQSSAIDTILRVERERPRHRQYRHGRGDRDGGRVAGAADCRGRRRALSGQEARTKRGDY